jgi:hypothetical protein
VLTDGTSTGGVLKSVRNSSMKVLILDIAITVVGA